MTGTSRSIRLIGWPHSKVGVAPAPAALRNLAVAAGFFWSVVFVVVGLRCDLQMYGDGSLFSYSVAVQDAWAFHWHNISGRLSVFLYAYLPPEAYVELFKDPHGGIIIYGLLFFIAPLLGLIATYAVDRSKGRKIFVYACASTAILCPLVFGFPTEVWISHALFWPALAICHYARSGIVGIALVFAVLLALVLTHMGAVLLAIAILMTLALRGLHDLAFRRGAALLLVGVAASIVIRVLLPPDSYDAEVLYRAALHVFDLSILSGALVLLSLAALAGYAIAYFLLRRVDREKAHIYAAVIVAVALAVYWLWFDHALHAENRYYLRTVLLLVTPVFGAIAAAQALAADDLLLLSVPLLQRVMAALTGKMASSMAVGAVMVVMLLNAVETTKFTHGWTAYTAAVRNLATGDASDPSLGDPGFVSSRRITDDLNRLSWFSTTPYLSVLLAPNFEPRRLVVDPTSSYFWLSCQTATANLNSRRSVPAESRRLVQIDACLHHRT